MTTEQKTTLRLLCCSDQPVPPTLRLEVVAYLSDDLFYPSRGAFGECKVRFGPQNRHIYCLGYAACNKSI